MLELVVSANDTRPDICLGAYAAKIPGFVISPLDSSSVILEMTPSRLPTIIYPHTMLSGFRNNHQIHPAYTIPT
ncbi:hypothetical protein V6N13_079416 [Hibiscus sabdariffa]